MSGSALYQTIAVCIVGLFGTIALMTLEILTPLQCAGFGGAFLLVAILRNRIENRTIKKSGDLFPQLRISALKKYALKWSALYPGLRQIVLYEAPATYPKIAGVTIKYLLIFEFRKWRKGRNGAKIFTEDNLGMTDHLFDGHFTEVYSNDDFPFDFRDHWVTDTVPHEDVNTKSSIMLWKK